MKRLIPDLNKLTPKNIVTAYALGVGLVFALLVPPFQKADEVVHYYKAASLLYGQWQCRDQPTGKPGIELPNKIVDFPGFMQFYMVRYNYEVKFPTTSFSIPNPTAKDSHPEVISGTVCNMPLLAYLPSALGMGLGLMMDNLPIAFYLGRLANLALYLIGLKAALSLIPKPFAPILLIFTVIPMVLHQVTAYTYDSLQLTITVWLFALWLHLLHSQTQINFKELLAFWLTLALNLMIKPGYLALIGLYLIIPASRLARNLKNYLYLSLLFFLGLGVSFALGFPKFAVNQDTPPGVNSPQQLNYLLSGPTIGWGLLTRTLKQNTDFYVQSLIGKFGWLEYGVDPWVIWLFVFGSGYALAKGSVPKTSLLPITGILALGGLLSIATLMIIFSLYLVWTPLKQTVITGVQGRYFLPLIPFAAYWLIQLKSALIKARVPKQAFWLIALLYLAYVVTNAIILRFFDYSKISSGTSQFQVK